MLTGKFLYEKLGNPETEHKHLTLWKNETGLPIGVIPNKIYCSKILIPSLDAAFHNLWTSSAYRNIKTWDGCYNVRPIRGYEKQYESLMSQGIIEKACELLSVHAWGLAIDIDANWNRLGHEPQMKGDVIECFEKVGFDWGGDFKRKDGMHFQLSEKQFEINIKKFIK